jgi:arylsulfatase/arylsulfatase A
VVVVMMDDLAYGDLACHGNPHVRTPNLDALHDESTRLTRYSSGPMCTPARASLMTGRYHQRTRAYDTFCGRSMIDPGEVTLGHVLGAAGYRTGAFGKWHLGDAYPMRATDLGFAETLVHGAGGIGQPGDHRENHWREGEAYFDPVLFRDGTPERVEGYCTDVFTDAAIDFVTRARADGAPFLCYLATNAPHTPLEVPEEWIERYRGVDGLGEVHARLYAMVENIDWNVGRLLAAIDPATTLVVYTSDHGPCPSARDFSLPPERQVRWNAGLRGEKGSLYDGAVKVPSFWRGPGIAASRDVGAVTSPIDVLPTLAAAVGAPLPAEVALDGIDLWPLLTGEAAEATDDERTLFLQWHRGNTQERYRNYAVVRGPWKLLRPTPDAPDELYDLLADPGETTSVAADHPAVVAALRVAYDEWYDDVATTRPDNWAPPRIIVGPEAGPGPVVLSRQDGRIDDGLADMGELAGWMASTAGWWELAVPEAVTVDAEVASTPSRGPTRPWPRRSTSASATGRGPLPASSRSPGTPSRGSPSTPATRPSRPGPPSSTARGPAPSTSTSSRPSRGRGRRRASSGGGDRRRAGW